MAYSQNDEESVIIGFLEQSGLKTGRFLDIGAFDGKTFSNTLRLAELGWAGVCIEPSPHVFPALLKLHENNPNIELVNAAVGLSAEMVDFFDSGGDAISTTSVAHMQKWTKGYHVNYKRFHVYTLPMTEIFRKFGLQFEFINLDVESTNWQLFSELPFGNLSGTRIICVEHDDQIERMETLAAPFGFRTLHTTAENLILVR